MTSQPTVFLIDDDEAMRTAVSATLRQAGLHTQGYASASEFLADESRGDRGCLVLDVRMPNMCGITLQQELVKRYSTIPILFITGYGDIDVSVRAMRNGAVDFLEKPVAPEVLLNRVREALAQDQRMAREQDQRSSVRHRFERLTARERQVVMLVMQGKTNKEISRELNISFRTVEKYRAMAMSKLQVGTAAELFRLGVYAPMPPPDAAVTRIPSGEYVKRARPR